MGGVPSVPTDRTRSVQVIGAGFSRTGTSSMALALEKLLDGPVMHGGTQLVGREDGRVPEATLSRLVYLRIQPADQTITAYVKLWCEILAQRHNKPVLMKLLREATAGFVALTDAPTTMFIEELIELYPDAKVVNVVRDPDQWYKSVEPLVNQNELPRWAISILTFWCPTWRWMPTWMEGYTQRLVIYNQLPN